MMHTSRLETTLASVRAIAALVVGCASTPTEQVGQTQAAIADAEQAKASEYAPVDLHEANRFVPELQAKRAIFVLLHESLSRQEERNVPIQS